jgi:hypothetical protein
MFTVDPAKPITPPPWSADVFPVTVEPIRLSVEAFTETPPPSSLSGPPHAPGQPKFVFPFVTVRFRSVTVPPPETIKTEPEPAPSSVALAPPPRWIVTVDVAV